MGALLRSHDWSRTSLGPPEDWPQSLKTTLRIMLTSRQPIWVGWGPQLIFFYNDAYKAIIGGKHPWALGRPTAEVWREIWPNIGPMLAKAMGGIEGTYVEEQLLIMERSGYPEETYYTFSYSPIPEDDGEAGGIICANVDDTKRVIGERQLALLRDVAAATADTRSWREVCERAVAALARNPFDLPFATIHMAESEASPLSLVGAAGIAGGAVGAPWAIATPEDLPWSCEEALRAHELKVASVLPPWGDSLPTGAWKERPLQVALLPLVPGGETGKRGLLSVGLNRYRLFDGDYRDFLKLLASQLAAAVANADAYEQERRRAESLAEIDRAKTHFFSNVSHEFRTPLTLMLAPLEESLADADLLPTWERERVRIAHRNGLRLLKLVNSLLDFSRIEAGRTRAVFAPTDLAALTLDIASTFRSAIEKAGMTLDIDCPPLREPVYVDRDLWEKIVLNLLSNAFKFTFVGGISVTLREHESGAELQVQDTGTGIPAHELPRLFERFHRIEGAQGRSFEGSGIGLALVKEMVEAHGGSIRVDSAEGRGSTFSVALQWGAAHLPAAQIREARPPSVVAGVATAFVEEAMRWLPAGVAEAVEASPDASANDRGAERHETAQARILLADDNADMRDYISRLLEPRHRCMPVHDGVQALEAIRRDRPDLLLTDIMMPRMDGFALIKAIRADAQLRDLPIIVISARAGEEASVEGLASGADDYLVKPFAARELVARVDGALAMARVRRSMGEALREEAKTLELLNRVGIAVAAELDLGRAVQVVTDAATELTGAAYGAFFYTVVDDGGQSYMLYALSGAPPEQFTEMPMPRKTPLFAPTFDGDGIVRSDDVLAEPRFGRNAPFHGMPPGHLPVRSYLTAPVVSRSGEVMGALFFGHPDPGVFTARSERLLAGIAAQAAIAIDNARLYQAAQRQIAERTRTEAALRESEERQIKLNQSLEGLVTARTAELETAITELQAQARERLKVEQALRQSQKMEALGKLTGGIAHDFNNLLQVVGGNLQLLAREVAGREQAELRVRNALAGVSRGSKLAAQLLAFGRRQPLAPKVVNLGRFVRGLDDLLRRALGDAIEIETVIAEGLWNTLVDPSQVENALLNLAINARDAMNAHGRLLLEAGNAVLDPAYAAQHEDVVPGEYVMLAVSDTGCGMTTEVIEHVFEPFFTTKPEGQGTGLGLSMVYGFVRQSEGHISIDSTPGQGTTVRLYLPRVHGVEDMPMDTPETPVVGGTETILVVEDDDQVRATVVALLEDLEYRVFTAPSAARALDILKTEPDIDLLFTDVVMPGAMRSPELAREARRRSPGIAVLYTSGYTSDTIVHGGRLDQGVELLSKPYTREALARRIRQVLSQRAAVKTRDAQRTVASPTRSAPRTLRILFVEDEELIRSATTLLLESLGHEVFAAEHGEQALAVLETISVDVLITDLALPGISGGRLAAEARRGNPLLKVVFATGADVAGDTNIPDGLLLRKPYDAAALDDVLREVGERRRAAH